ncbi:MAG: cellulase family glycosylhydrolase [Candidatus Dormibacteraeota bacterium]|nr:cellulase family glycosylhydrolase [Candidatus Dormibacteraeota bacterium]MBV9525842.1 cellulase family glycosylhydrolase [Candidatus Dormibacteraeota bacterium]
MKGRAQRRGLLAVVIACAAVVAGALAPSRGAAPPLQAQPASAGFVGAARGHFTLDGAPWTFTGYDAYYAASLHTGYQCGPALSDQEVDSFFSEMQQRNGSLVLRTWFFQSFQNGNPANFAQYDRLLAAAAAHGIRVVATLSNQWGACEPGHPYHSITWYQGGYRQTNDGYPLSFRDFAVSMARHYANNPTIAMWQLVNEGEAASSHGGSCNESAAAQALRSFGDDVTAGMKAVDPNHLVNLGTMGGGQCGTSGADYAYVNGGRTDVCELHDYAHQVVMGGRTSGIVPDTHTCGGLGKPLFAGEVGIDASVLPNWSLSGVVTPVTLATRAVLFQQKMDAMFSLGVSGFLIWSKTLTPSVSWHVGPGDPTEAVMLAHQLRFDAVWASLRGHGYGAGSGGTALSAEFAAIGTGLDNALLSLSLSPGWLEDRVR